MNFNISKMFYYLNGKNRKVSLGGGGGGGGGGGALSNTKSYSRRGKFK